MMTADSLREIFGCKDDVELGKIFNRSGSVVSVWRIKGLPASIERRARELMQERGIETEADRELLRQQPKEIQMLVAELDGLTGIEVLQMLADYAKTL